MNLKKLVRFPALFLSLPFLIGIGACGSSAGTDTRSYTAKLTSQKITPFDPDFVSGINRFGLLAAAELYDDQNLFLSPVSLELALLMTASGAGGNTKSEMLSALQMSGVSDQTIAAGVSQLMWRSNTNGMEAANSLWMQKSLDFLPSFLDTCKDTYLSDCFIADFKTDATGATEDINRWGNEKTHGKIPKINDTPLSPDTRLVLVNALYFLGDWASPFKAENTFDETFHGASSDTSVPFMNKTSTFAYSKEDNYAALSMDFKKTDADGTGYSLAFLLPDEGSSVRDTLQSLESTGFSAVLKDMNSTKVQVSVPKFAFTYSASMSQTLSSLGMTDAFNPGLSDFSGMTVEPNDLYIGDVLHKCYIRIDEKGAEAAAITEVIMKTTAVFEEDPPIEFNVDRPFLFVIYDPLDGTILFVGAVAQIDPS